MSAGVADSIRAQPLKRWRRLPASWPAADVVVGHAGLAALLVGGLWIAFGAASNDLIVDTAGADEPNWVRGPLAGVIGGLSDTGFGVALLLMLPGYAVVVIRWQVLDRRLALGVLAVLALVFALAPPILSSDVFGYIGYGRLGVVHHLNPYAHGVIAAPHDPIRPLVYWQTPISPYGPLFTIGSYALAGHSLPAQLWTYKALGALALLASLALVWQAARRMDRPPLQAALLLGANPLLLVFAVGGAHNDLIVMIVVLAALLLLATRRALWGGAALATATAIKLTGGLLLPFVLLGASDRRRALLGLALAAIPLTALTLVVFGTHMFDTIGHIATGSAFENDYSGPGFIGSLLGTGVSAGVLAGCAAAFAVALALSLRAVRRGSDWLTAAGWATLALLCAIQSFIPWYLAWLLPMAALTHSRALRIAVVVFTAAVTATHLPMLGFPES